MRTRKKLLAVLCGIVVFLNLSINFFAVFSLVWIGSETQEIAGEFEKIAELMQDENAVSQLALSRLGQSTAMSSSAVRLRQELQERTLSGSRGKVEAAAKEYLDGLITLAGNMAEKLSSRSIVLSLSYDYVYLNPQNAKKNLQSARRIVGELQAESERAGQRNTYMGYLKGKNAGLGYVYVYQALIMTLALQMNDGGMVVLEGQEDSFAVMLLLFDKQEEIVDFLLQNQKKWSVSSTGRLVITDSNVQREYQRIAKERNELLQRLDG